jgi:polyhydroxyalkanoate synthesis regulator phasin
MNEEQKTILKMVESGQITAAEAATLLELVSESEPVDSEHVQEEQRFSTGVKEREREWPRTRPYWLYPLSAGLVVMLVGGAVVTTAYQRGRVSPWTWLCGWIPLFLGLSVVAIAAWTRTAHWVHLRVISQEDRVVLGFPLPLRLTALAVGIARRFIPQFRDTGIDEAFLGLRDGLHDDQPITLEVNDEDEGEHIQIYVGPPSPKRSRRRTMSLAEERMQILNMIQSGQITADEGAKLLSALKASRKESASAESARPRWFRLRVSDLKTGKSKVNMNIPMALVDVGIKMGARFVPDTGDVDLEEIREALRSGQQGKILDVEDVEDEERIEIFVE